MYCPKCTARIQDDTVGSCPSCGHSVEKSLYLDASVKIDDNSIILDDALHSPAGPCENSEHSADFGLLENPTADAGESRERARADIKKIWQPRSLDQMDDLNRQEELRPRRGGAKSLAFSVITGGFLLLGVMLGGFFQLRYKDAPMAEARQSSKALVLPPASAPAPTFKRPAQGLEQQTEAAAPSETHAVVAESQEPEPQKPEQPHVSAQEHRPQPPPAAAKPAAPEPAAAVKPAPAPVAVKPRLAAAIPVKGGNFMLLCGSFQDRGKAAHVAETMRKRRFAAFVEEADLGSRGVWYRIKIGGLQTRQDAEKTRSELKKKLNMDGVISTKK